MRARVEIGALYSTSGSYALLARASLRGLLGGIAAVNADPAGAVTFVPVLRDPGGCLDSYAPLAGDILRGSGARHIFGCTTSASRKEVIPVLDRHRASLWYAAPYEGFEASDHVAYLGACPNQHLLPLLDWALPTLGRRVCLTGSNYIWGWEVNRLARQVIDGAAGAVLTERYLPVGDCAIADMVAEIAAARPDFVLNSLIGASQYAFLAAMRRAAPGLPILSCNLTECELPALGEAAEGLIAAGPYFREGTDGFADAFEARVHEGVRELARLLARDPGAQHLPLSALLADQPPGTGLIDPRTHHCRLPVIIAEVAGGAFRPILRHPPVEGAPFAQAIAAPSPRRARPALRVVS